MKTKDVIAEYDKYVMPTYTRAPVVFVKGKGSKLWDIEGKEYLDFFPGWGVSGLGHCSPKVVNAIKNQSSKIIHISNNYYSVLQGKLAKTIIKHSFDGKIFFCNSGAEAVESAVKLARKFGAESNRFEIITMEKSFHGRTLAALTATGQQKVQTGFEPLPTGFKYAAFNDIDAIKKVITDKTVAVMLEVIQGEGGINIAKQEYIKEIRKICNHKNILLIFDEVQTGMGRTGKMFAYQHYGVKPDMMLLAKALGGGVPIGALVASSKIADVLGQGSHGSTFGGSPIVTKAALSVFDTIKKQGLLSKANTMGDYLRVKLAELKAKTNIIKEVRGMGLMIGVELSVNAGEIAKRCFDKRLLINATQGNILRIVPALTVTKKEIDKAMYILERVITGLSLQEPKEMR